MTKMSNLPIDLAEEVLYRIPMKSLTSVRSACNNWNNICKDRRFAKKYLARQAKVAEATETEFKVVMVMEFRVYLMSVNLHNNVDQPCIKRAAKLLSTDDQAYVSQVFHCNGLLLCVMKNEFRLMVCNPYWGQSRWIETTGESIRMERYCYALGYDNISKSHKILTFVILNYHEFKIYDLKSGSWKVLDVSRDWDIYYLNHGVSLKGNTYWLANERYQDRSFLLCFDFTRETFGPRLRLPIGWHVKYTPTPLSSVRDEQLVVLFQRLDINQMEIWVTTKIEPDSVSWSSKFFLQVDMRSLVGSKSTFPLMYASFFIDEEKKVAVVFDEDKEKNVQNEAFIVGQGSLKEVDLGGPPNQLHHPHVCSYVPSSMQFY